MPAKKADFPQKGRAITIIVPAATGGGTDTAARMVGPEIEKDLGVPVQVENVPGGGTVTGSLRIAQAKPDGYTFGILSLVSLVVNYQDPEKKLSLGHRDFQSIAMYSMEPSIMLVQSGSPFKELPDLVAASKANPGKVSMATTSLLGAPHLGGAGLEKETGADFAFVAFDGSAPAVTALLGGHVNATHVAIGGSSAGPVSSGQARIIGITSKQRSPFYPEVKTWSEYGYKTSLGSAYSFAAPAGTPREIVDIVSASLKKAMASDGVKQRAKQMTVTPQYMDPAQTDAYWNELETTVKDATAWAKMKMK